MHITRMPSSRCQRAMDNNNVEDVHGSLDYRRPWLRPGGGKHFLWGVPFIHWFACCWVRENKNKIQSKKFKNIYEQLNLKLNLEEKNLKHCVLVCKICFLVVEQLQGDVIRILSFILPQSNFIWKRKYIQLDVKCWKNIKSRCELFWFGGQTFLKRYSLSFSRILFWQCQPYNRRWYVRERHRRRLNV